MQQVDLEDGVADGKVTKAPGRVGGTCPECSHRVEAKRERCLYCGYEF